MPDKNDVNSFIIKKGFAADLSLKNGEYYVYKVGFNPTYKIFIFFEDKNYQAYFSIRFDNFLSLIYSSGNATLKEQGHKFIST